MTLHRSPAITDTIPRISVRQEMEALVFLFESGGENRFEDVRAFMLSNSRQSTRRGTLGMWAATRELLIDLKKLMLVEAGPLPGSVPDAGTAANHPCRLTDAGLELVRLYLEDEGAAYDRMLAIWIEHHPYFRSLLVRLQSGPLFLPEITSNKQVPADLFSEPDPERFGERMAQLCSDLLQGRCFTEDSMRLLREEIRQNAVVLLQRKDLVEFNAKTRLIMIQYRVITQAVLSLENLPCDAVSFRHLVRAARDFLVATSTCAHPGFPARAYFVTCDFSPALKMDQNPHLYVRHHGVRYVREGFPQALRAAYDSLSDESGGYVDIYELRAMVCLAMRIQQKVFDACIPRYIAENAHLVGTELSFDLPPSGEDPVIVKDAKIGLLRIMPRKEEHVQ